MAEVTIWPSKARARTYHLALNPDVVIGAARLSREAIEFFEANPEVGMLAPEVRGADGMSAIPVQTLSHRRRSRLTRLCAGIPFGGCSAAASITMKCETC